MASPATPAPKVSWLKRFGQEVAKILGIVVKDAPAVESVAVPLAETLFPAAAPAIALGASWFDKALNLIMINEATFTAVGQASNGPAKLAAVSQGIQADVDAWVAANFPGSAAIQKGEEYLAQRQALITAYTNSVVSFANWLDGHAVPPAPTASAVAAASAAVAAVNAVVPKTGN